MKNPSRAQTCLFRWTGRKDGMRSLNPQKEKQEMKTFRELNMSGVACFVADNVE